MKNTVGITLLVTLCLSACTMPAGRSPTPIPINTASVTSDAQGTPVSYQNVSFIIPIELAKGAVSETIPLADETNSDPWGIAPEHIEFTLIGYPLADAVFKPTIRIYPAQEYTAANSWAADSLTRLQAVLAQPAAPLTNDTLPTSPFNGAAAQQYAAQAKFIPFHEGMGVRMISQYGQFPGPIIRNNSIYHYEGLTSDGKYLVAALFPIVLPLQSSAEDPSADGIPFPSAPLDNALMTTYYQAITDKLNTAEADAFQPSLTQFDALIQSITINTP